MIHVYSDSFGETHGAGTWPAKLEYIREEEVKINGSGGTGPNWSLRKLINDLETSKIKNSAWKWTPSLKNDYLVVFYINL